MIGAYAVLFYLAVNFIKYRVKQMQPFNISVSTARLKRGRRAGSTLVEVLVSMIMFALVSMGITASLIQQRKQSENALYLTNAQATAEGILDQIKRLGFTNLSDFTKAFASAPDDYPSGSGVGETALDSSSTSYITYRSVPLIFIGEGPIKNGLQTGYPQDFNLYWAADTTNFFEIGARVDPDDLKTPIIGVLADLSYNDSSATVLRASRYMKMFVSITRRLNANKDTVEVTLRYKWAIPDRRTASGALIYYSSRELRAIVSKISTY